MNMTYKWVITVLVIVAGTGIVGAVDLSNSDMAKEMFSGFVEEDAAAKAASPPYSAWYAVQPQMDVGGFDYAEVADMTMAAKEFSFPRLVPISKVRGPGRYTAGISYYIQP